MIKITKDDSINEWITALEAVRRAASNLALNWRLDARLIQMEGDFKALESALLVADKKACIVTGTHPQLIDWATVSVKGEA